MSDLNVPSLTNLTTITADDLLYLVNDPSGTPADRKAIASVLAAYVRTTAWSMVDEDTVVVTSGDIALNTTSIADLTATQITLNGATTGDVVYYHLSAIVSAATGTKGFDAYTYPSGTRTNPFGPGVTASLATLGGYQAWLHASNTGGFNLPISGVARRTLVSGDIAGGNVIVGLATAGTVTTAKTLFASTNNPLQVIAQLWRPPT